MREIATAAPLPHRYLGLELSGAKNQKTALATIEYYPKERKIFLLDLYDRILPAEGQTGDQALLELIHEVSPGLALMGVNVPLTLPPCMTCSRTRCRTQCSQASVKWMRELTRKASKQRDLRVLEFTPYTQRPIELWVRYRVLPLISENQQFEIDEALGGNRAPLTARMHFLKDFLPTAKVVEAWPKLTVALLSSGLDLDPRIFARYRQLEEGAHARSKILEAMSLKFGLFIYDRDLKKLSASLAAFDAFICAYTALLSDTGGCEKMPPGFPAAAGWLHYPRGQKSARGRR